MARLNKKDTLKDIVEVAQEAKGKYDAATYQAVDETLTEVSVRLGLVKPKKKKGE